MLIKHKKISLIVSKIEEWEYYTGESFSESFMGSRFNREHWMFWLLGTGKHNEHANNQINKMYKRGLREYMDLSELYNVYNETERDKNIKLWAEFIMSCDKYLDITNEFFNVQKWKF